MITLYNLTSINNIYPTQSVYYSFKLFRCDDAINFEILPFPNHFNLTMVAASFVDGLLLKKKNGGENIQIKLIIESSL